MSWRAPPDPGGTVRNNRALRIIERELAGQDVYKGTARVLISRLWREYLSKHRWQLLAGIAACVAGAAIQLGFSMTIRFLFDNVLAAGDYTAPGELHRRTGLAVLFLFMNSGIWIVHLSCQWAKSVTIRTASFRLVFDLRRDLNEKLHNLHIGFFERTPSGRIISRLLDDVDMVRHWVSGQLMDFVGGITRLIAGTALAFYLNWRIALVVLAVLPLYFLAIFFLRPRVRRANITLRRLNSSMYARASERIGAMPVIRAFTREKRESAGFARIVHDYVRVGNRMVVYNQGMSFTAGAISAIAAGIVIFMAALNVKNGTMTLGDLIAFQRILNHMFDPIQQLTTIFIQFQAVLVVLNRIFNLLDEKVEVEPGTCDLVRVKWPLCLDNVSLKYPVQESAAVEGITLRVEQGERVAIMGPSGSGKSTLFQLLMRFYDPTSGSVTLGAQNIRELETGALRSHIRMVQQEPFIFSGTIRSNIQYGHLEATHEQVEHAARLAELHNFIMTLPAGYDTEVGEKGIALSGGQKQRLALATALLTDPEILLLDDITSSLDAETEAKIRDTLRTVLAHRTSIIITQRIAMARDCDRIVVLDGGRIEAVGRHEDLKRVDGFYQGVCERQGWG